MRCICGDCSYNSVRYTSRASSQQKRFFGKAGALIITKTPKIFVLLVQSRGRLWGCPKGSLEALESVEEGARREIFEETGMLFKSLGTPIQVNKGVFFYFIETTGRYNLSVQTNKHSKNDANSIGWFSIRCLSLGENQDDLNTHTKKILKMTKLLEDSAALT